MGTVKALKHILNAGSIRAKRLAKGEERLNGIERRAAEVEKQARRGRWRGLALRSALISAAVCCVLPLLLTLFFASPAMAEEEENWRRFLLGEWMLGFFQSGTPSSRPFKEMWDRFSAKTTGVKVGIVDISENPELSARFLVTKYPAIFHCKNGVCREYQGSLSTNAILDFVQNKKWQKIDSVPDWLGPSSLAIEFLVPFYTFNVFLKNVLKYLTEEAGLPLWGSYTTLAILVLLIGVLVAMILDKIFEVCLFPFISRRFSPD
ncbi:thioredoxin-related transmembrane protein 1-like isoform X2 [Polypterus senegalus]|uniref:thioredoxin-related transmembrane protein 1-like isoform X2 n=1 Tax=Polypterus senegalus TaxID=55291 RepID=UPI001964540F|nr:thioredoxin-related transmembrane protein 1-like isoform X2 [Polypterus senegalus]